MDEYEVNGKMWKVGDDTSLGEITEWFTCDGEMCFFTKSGAFYPARYLFTQSK